MQNAAAMHVGVSRRSILAMLALETLTWTIGTTLLTVGLGLWLARFADPSEQPYLGSIGLRILAASVGGAFAGVGFGAAFTREDHLFRYFKMR
ncbi:hypothetical protein SAMN04515692_11726 [Leifsonia sp. CL147]|nr:hypothetical protein SAMN04515692_11726 [Leifsonia sp. CL147]